MRAARSPSRQRPHLSKELPVVVQSVLDAILLVVSLITMAFVRHGSFRIFRGGARVTASQLFTIDGWTGKMFPTANKHIQRTYCTRSAGDNKSIRQVWNSDRYYIQAGVKSDISVGDSPLLAMMMTQHRTLDIAVRILQAMFTVQTVSVWINGKGEAVTQTHFDSDHNLVIILHGTCVFYTAPREAFQPGGSGCRMNESSNTPYSTNFFTKRPMCAGMMAMQPANMWHYVESSEHCVKLAIFFC